MHAFAVVLTNLRDSVKEIMFISNVRYLLHWMSGQGDPLDEEDVVE